MKRRFTILTAALTLLAFLALPMGMWGQTTTLVSGSGTSGYSIPEGWTSSGTVEGGSYLKFDDGSITSPEFAPHNGISFTYSVATFGSGTNHPLTIRILNASTDAVISEMTTATPTSSTYINTGSPLSLGDVTVAFKIQMYGPTGKGVRLRNYSVTGTPAGGQQLTPSDLALVDAPVELEFDLYDNDDPQTISYTTSSTGEVTVSQSDYITATVNANNTITVTPVAVTNGPQTITINQAADDTYATGSVTFTVDIEDSTPFTGGDVTFLAGTDLGSTSANNSPDEMEKNGVTVYSTDAAFATAQYRLYQSSITTISVASGTITNIVFNGQSTSYPVDRLSVNDNNGSFIVSNNVGTWTGNTDEVSFSASGQVRLSSIVVTVELSGTPDPTISASNVDIAYNATSGSITYTINNEPSPAGTLTATVTEGNWLTLGQGTTSPIAFTCTANENTTARTAMVTLTYTYNTDQTVSANVSVTQAAAPVIYDDIEDLFNAATSTATDVTVSFESWFVTGVSTNGKNVYVTDGTNGFVIFDNNGGLGDTYHVNDLIEGTTTASLVLYTGFAELKNVDATNLTMTSYEAPAFADVAMADLSGINTGALLHYDNLTCSVNTSGNTPKYYLSDGTTTLQVYNALYAFNALENGKIYNITGVYQQYNNTKEILPRSADDIEEVVSTVPSITVDPDEVNVDAEEHDGTLGLTYENLTITDMEDFGIQYYDAEGEETTEPDWIEVLVAEQDPQIGEGYVVSYYMVENEGEARTAYFKVFALGDEDFVYSNLVTVNQAAPVAPVTGDEYVLYTGELVEGDYLVVYGDKAMNNVVSSDRLQYEVVTVTENTITTDHAAIIWHIAPSGSYWTIYNADANAYAAGTGVKNKAQMLADGTDDKALWTVSGTETFEFVNKANDDAGVNANLRNNGTYGFACYATSTGGALSLYKKVEATETYTLDITGYTANSTGGYYLIASPVTVDPATVEGMTEGAFDLYSFDQAEEDEWRNYEAQPFNLVPGKGYLYAKQATTEGEIFHFTLTGTPYSGDGMIELDYTEGGDFPGWNLVGNPYGVAAEISNDFYVMNGDGTEIIAGESELVEPMQGVFVIAENDDDYVIFEPAVAPGPGNEKLVMNVRRERGNVIDRAIVRFGEGRQLPKFQLNANSTKLYIVEGENEYAVVRSANEGEMPVSFKAAENGTYTLSVDAENMEMSYLHLIDNMTKADVDLLANPNYTFEANTTDLATRFTLVFAATGMNENTTQSFAFFNGSEWVISNMGEATLQVVDVMGRIVSSETINGNASVSLNQTSGVYMLRLVNGDNVKVQKVVVR